MRIVIVGAGVAGCIVAKRLSKLPDAEVICLERVSADDQSDSGTGLNIGPNSVRALQSHDPDLLAQMDATSFNMGQLAHVADRRHGSVSPSAVAGRRQSGPAHPLVGALSRAARVGRSGGRL